LGAGEKHLRSVDPVMRELIDSRGPIDAATDRRGSRPDPFEALARAIVGQQLSTKAARSIWERVVEALGGTASPEAFTSADPAALRAAGLSNSKVAYLRDLAEHVASGELDLARLAELPDEDVIADLIEVKGIGRWTAEMFLIFHLERPDVLSGGDLGIRKAVQLEYGLDEMPTPQEVLEIGEAWRPHRSLASLYLWESLAAVPGA
jgi:DNA-3-methyladenine glycosylase II